MHEKMAAAPPARMSEIDAFGQNLVEAGNDLGPSSSYGKESHLIQKFSQS